MKIVIFGLTISSSWGNGHATLWRGLCRALARLRHRVVFFERDTPYYAAHRDLDELPGGELLLYSDWDEAVRLSRRHLADAEVGMITSYCPDGTAAADLVLSAPLGARVFYDLDTPVTLASLRAGRPVPYLGPRGLCDFDLVLSYTGGVALDELSRTLGARRVAPLYGSVDPELHRPAPPPGGAVWDLSYLGTYAEDRQSALEALLLEPARRSPQRRFLIGGAQYPSDFPWTENIDFRRHVPPADHAGFYAASRLTLNVTRRAMAEMGYCPSGRLFEAAACGVPILSDGWAGLEMFFEPGAEILLAATTDEALSAIQRSDEELARIARAARARTLEEHTAERRARDLVDVLGSLGAGARALPPARSGESLREKG
jgi:spore maturation protein CgeB